MDDDVRLTPAQEEDVRRLLADARPTEPMPPEVAARLDRVLDGLSGEPVREATVVRLAARRRRAATLLVAAAVVVTGVGIGELIGSDGLGAESETAQEAEAGAAAERSAEGPAAAEDRDRGTMRDGVSSRETVRIRPDRFAADVARLRATAAAAYAQGGVAADDQLRELDAATALVCRPGEWGPGHYRAVRYAGSVGYVVFRRPRGDTQVADLFLCGSELAVRSVTLPSP